MPEPAAPALDQAGARVAAARGGAATAHRPTAVLIAAYLLFSALLALLLRAGTSDLDLFFWPSAEAAAHGHPLLVYAVRTGAYPDANGPLALLPLGLVAALANLLGWQAEPARSALTLGLMGVFPLLMAREAVLLVEEGRGRIERRVLAHAAFALAPALFISVAAAGHVEQPVELWLTLVAARLVLRGRPGVAGCVLGLVLLTRSAALVAVLTLALVVLSGAAARARGSAPSLPRRIASALSLLAGAGLVTGLGLLPFLLADRHDVVFSLLTYRGSLPIGGGTWWALLARGQPWQGLVQHGDTVLFGAAGAALVALMLWRGRGRALTPGALAALLTVSAACVPMLAKTAWGYYALDPYVFAAVWWLARPGPVLTWRVIAPVLLTVDSVMLSTRQVIPPPPSQVVEGMIASLLMVAVVALVMRDRFAAGTRTAPAAGSGHPPVDAGGRAPAGLPRLSSQ